MFKAVLIASIALLSFCIEASAQNKKSKQYPRVKFTSVSMSKADTLQFTAIVKSIYKCPPCPEGAQCKPCIGDHVLVTNGHPELDFRVFTHQLSLFKISESYDFLVRFRSELHRDDNIELITARPKK